MPISPTVLGVLGIEVDIDGVRGPAAGLLHYQLIAVHSRMTLKSERHWS